MKPIRVGIKRDHAGVSIAYCTWLFFLMVISLSLRGAYFVLMKSVGRNIVNRDGCLNKEFHYRYINLNSDLSDKH